MKIYTYISRNTRNTYKESVYKCSNTFLSPIFRFVTNMTNTITIVSSRVLICNLVVQVKIQNISYNTRNTYRESVYERSNTFLSSISRFVSNDKYNHHVSQSVIQIRANSEHFIQHAWYIRRMYLQYILLSPYERIPRFFSNITNINATVAISLSYSCNCLSLQFRVLVT